MTFLNRSVFALVPARGGSKGVPRKNLRPANGHPLLWYTAEAALASLYIDKSFLSSDDQEILALGASMDLELIERPAEQSSDTSTASAVVQHFLSTLTVTVTDDDPFIVYLQPTSPLRTAKHIDAAFAALESSGQEKLISVVSLARSPYKSLGLDDEGLLRPLFSEETSTANRQDLPLSFYPNGAIYIFPASEFVRRRGFPISGSMPFVMSDQDSLDIDTDEDLALLEKIMRTSCG